jgi:lipopolysaccharide/colanic/teichoic acid biosynthesis glycosyltransferase
MQAGGVTTIQPEITAAATGESRFTAAACRALDIVVAAVLLVVLLPLFALIAIAIRIDSPGRVVFRQRRVGRGRRLFTVNKFRTMRSDADHETHRTFVLHLITADGSDEASDKPFFKMSSDSRVTRVGRVMRKSSLDELPQLWNVLKGEMSLVGPRPATPREVALYEDWQLQRLETPPGITGLWQVSGRSELSYEDLRHLDTVYVSSWSLWWDLRILAQTPAAVLRRSGAY